MHIRKYLSIFLIGLVFAIAGCSSDSTSGISDEDRLPDTDNDGIVDKHDPDIDGDGILNKDDADDDGDGTPDTTDPTPNGDGGEAPTPGRACTSAEIYPPKDGQTGRLNTASWGLLPKGCESTVSSLIVVTASAETAARSGKSTTTQSQSVGVGRLTANIVLPQDCNWSGEQTITYDFSEIGNALGDTSNKYTAERPATVSSCKDAVINVENLRNRTTYLKVDSTVNLSGTVTGVVPQNGAAGLYEPASEISSVAISRLSEPKWSATPKGYMNIYTTGNGCALKQVDIDPAEAAGSYITRPSDGSAWKHYKTWELLQAAEEVKGCKVNKRPGGMGALGNFVVTWTGSGSEFTIISYSP